MGLVVCYKFEIALYRCSFLSSPHALSHVCAAFMYVPRFYYSLPGKIPEMLRALSKRINIDFNPALERIARL